MPGKKKPRFLRRRQCYGQGPASTPEARYARKQAALWLSRLLQCNVPHNEAFFMCLGWCAGDFKRLTKALSAYLSALPQKPATTAALAAVKKINELSPLLHPDALEDLAHNHPCIRNKMHHFIFEECQAVHKTPVSDCEAFTTAKKRLRKLFGLDNEAAALCEFVFINRSFSPVENYFENHLEYYKYGNRRILAQILGFSPTVLQNCLSQVANCGVLDIESFFTLNEGLEALWNAATGPELNKMFCRPLTGKTLPLEEFSIDKADRDHLAALMALPDDSPKHILLYGAPGTGKTTFAHSLARHLGVKAWAVPSREHDKESDRRAALTACLHMAARHKGAFVLVDEAERLLDTGQMFGRPAKDKAWLNDFLEQPGRRVIWISNQIRHIDQAVRRRFAFSVHFEELGNSERAKIWQKTLARHRVGKRLNAAQRENLATTYNVPTAVIEQAVAQAKQLYSASPDFHGGLERILQSYATLRCNGKKTPPKTRAASDYTLDGVCVEGTGAEIMEKCRRVDAAMRQGGPLRPGSATMLFYGPPGTGKTALARYIAKELKRECLVQRASDLISPYVGESEQNVAAAFKNAEASGSILVVDEADSFLYSRDIAVRSWESSLVNEFLTALEECRGFCICTTNRREQLDPAAMRRFSYKLAFNYAKPEQVAALYHKLLAPLCPDALTPAQRTELAGLQRLTPGDFHAVRSQYDSLFADTAALTHQKLLEALIREQSLKNEKQARRIGFGGRNG